VELAPLSDGTLILNELAPLFGVHAAGDRTLLDALLAALRPKHALLIIDNCEHLVDPAADIIERILRACPRVHILATSREALKIPGETVHRVASLDEEAGIALFAERAGAASDSFVLNEANIATVAKICRRLDGIALAIELAAARVRAVDVNELFARLDERFRILTGGSRTALPRQQTMRALIDWSYDLLTAPEQALLRRVAVFNGGWTLDAATAICADDDLQSWDILDLLTSLVDKSLVTAELNDALISGSKLRYRLLESTRQYASEKLQASGERQRLRAAHAAYFTSVAEKAEHAWKTTPTKTWLPPLESEIDNFRGALNWTLNEKEDRELGGLLAAALWPMWTELGTRAEGIRYAERALAFADELPPLTRARLWFTVSILSQHAWKKTVETAEKARALFMDLGDEAGAMRTNLSAGEGLTRLGELERGNDKLVEAVDFFRAAREERWTNYTMSALGRNALWRGEAQLARDRFSHVLTTARAQGDDRLVSVIMNNLAESEFNVGNIDRAIELGQEIITRDRMRHDPDSLCFALTNIAAYFIAAGRIEEAHPMAIEALRRSLDLQLDGLIAGSIQHLAFIAALRGEHERAALLLGFTDTFLAKGVSPREMTEQQEYDRLMPILREGLGEQRLKELLAQGRGITNEHAAADALAI
ncbi:MAG TPA: hypothetical protein VFE17_03215, partial [Candidatus Baltobacteraceae bacterium]|nr:hypothetical protein [Candidatus Baltobacteraceae bacterium]